MTGGWMTAGRIGKRRRTAIAWLAVLALLINALVPASLAAAVGSGGESPSGWCGAAPGGPHPAKSDARSCCDHCILCSPTALGLEPPVAAKAGTPILAATLVLDDIAPAIPPQRLAYRVAQPRGPPIPIA